MSKRSNTAVPRLLLILTSGLFFRTTAFAGTEMSSLSMSPLAALSGQTVTGTAKLNERCRNTNGCIVSLSSNNRSAAPVPASVTIASGSTSKTFSFVAGSVSAKTVVNISASYGGRTRSTGTSFSVSPSGTTSPAASCTFNGQTVASGSSVTAYQASSVPSGQSCVSQTRTCSNGVLSGSYQYASCSVQASTAPVSIATWQASAVDLAGAHIRYDYVDIMESAAFKGSFSAPCDNPSGCYIYYSSSHPQWMPVSEWSMLYQGMSTFSTRATRPMGIDLSTLPDSFTLTVTATYNGVSKSASIPVIVRYPLAVSSISHGDASSLNPMGGQRVLYTIEMNGLCKNSNGCQVALSSSNTAVMPIPSSVTVPFNGSWAQVSFNTGDLSATTAVTLQASYAGSIARSTYTVKASWPRLADGTIVMQAYGEDYVGHTANSYRDPNAKQYAIEAMQNQANTLLASQCEIAYPGTGRLVAQGTPQTGTITYSSGAIYAYAKQTYHCYRQ